MKRIPRPSVASAALLVSAHRGFSSQHHRPQLFHEGGGDDPITEQGLRNEGPLLTSRKGRRGFSKGSYRSAAPLFPSRQRSNNAGEDEGPSSTRQHGAGHSTPFNEEGVRGSLTSGAMGAAVPIRFERAVKSGTLQDKAVYSLLRDSEIADKSAESKRIRAATQRGPAHSHSIFDPTFDKGVSVENLSIAAAAEAEYAFSKQALEGNSGSSDVRGLLKDANAAWEALLGGGGGGIDGEMMTKRLGEDGGRRREAYKALDAGADAVAAEDDADADYHTIDLDEPEKPQPLPRPQHQKVLLSPFGETLVPSTRKSFVGKEGSYEYLNNYKKQVNPTYTALALSPIALQSQRTERAMLDVTTSPMSLPQKRTILAQLSEGAFKHNLMLRPSTVESVISLLSRTTRREQKEAVAKLQKALPAGSTAASLQKNGDNYGNALVVPTPNPSHSLIVSLYFHLKGTLAAPTALTIERVMHVLHQAVLVEGAAKGSATPLALGRGGGGGGGDANTDGPQQLQHDDRGPTAFVKRSPEAYTLFNLAGKLLLDCDKYFVLPTRTTLTHYFALCAHFGEMDVAIRRLVDVQKNLAIIPSSAMLETALRGLTRWGLMDEALALVGTFEEAQMTVGLFNASVEALLLSADPNACFAAYSSVMNANGSRSDLIVPNSDTYALLLLACEKRGDWSLAPKLLQHMQHFEVRGDANCLNLLLKGLLKNNLNAYAKQLCDTMRFKRVKVWPALEKAIADIRAKETLGAGAGGRGGSAIDDDDRRRGSIDVDGEAESVLSSVSQNSFDAFVRAHMNRGEAVDAEEEDGDERARCSGEEEEEDANDGVDLRALSSSLRASSDAIESRNDADFDFSLDYASDADTPSAADAFAGTNTSKKSPPSPPPHADDVSNGTTIDLLGAFGDDFKEDADEVSPPPSPHLSSSSSSATKKLPSPFASTPQKKKASESLKRSASSSLSSALDADMGDRDDDADGVQPFWDLDDDGELDALGVDGGEEVAMDDADDDANDDLEGAGCENDAASEKKPLRTITSHISRRAIPSVVGEEESGEATATTMPPGREGIPRRRTPPSVLTPQQVSAKMRRASQRQFIVPRDVKHLEELMRRRRGDVIDPEYLLNFVESRGVVLSYGQSRSPTTLLRKAHKLVFGTTGLQHGSASNYLTRNGRYSAGGGEGTSRFEMNAIAKKMFAGSETGSRHKYRRKSVV